MIVSVTISEEQEKYLYDNRYNRSSLLRQAIEKLQSGEFIYDNEEKKRYKELRKNNDSLSTINEERRETD